MLDRWKDSRQMHVLNVRVRAELYTGKAQRYFPFHGSAKTFRDEIRRNNAAVVNGVAGATRESGGVKNVVTQLNVASSEAARPFVLAVRQCSLSAYIDVPGRHLGRTKRLAEVEQFDPSPVAEAPFRFSEVGHFRLCIKVR